MRKKVSFLLSLIMILSTCVIDPVYAAANGNILLKYLPKVGLKETQTGLIESEISKDDEEAALEWSLAKGDGKYELIYYSDSINDNSGDTTKVTLGIEVGKNKADENVQGKAKVTAELTKSNGDNIPFLGYQRIFPYTGAADTITTTINGKNIAVAELTLPGYGNAVANSAKELSLKLGKNLSVRIKTDGETVKVWTNQINKGYITDFTLFYDNQEQSTQVVFPGVAGIKVSSIHLEEGNGLKDRTDLINASEGDQAGSHPGVKVEFQRLLVRNGAKYEKISGSEAEKLTATVNLQTKLEPDNTVKTNQNQVTFNMSGSDKLTGEYIKKDKLISIENAAQPGIYDADGDKICLYYVKDENWVDKQQSVKEHVIPWPVLEESMVIGGELTITGKITVAGKQYEVNTGNVALNTGYTYLKFTPEQSNAGEVTLQITPYKYKGEVVYQVYSVNGKTPTNLNSTSCLFGTYKFTYDPTYPNRKLEISMPSGAESIFMIKAILSKETDNAMSQNVYYDINGSHVIIKPYTPQIKEVNGVYVIPEDKTGVEAAGFNIAWSAPSKQKLLETLQDKKELYYELSLYDSEKANKAVISVFKLELDETDPKNVQLKITQLGRNQGEVTYDEDNQQFIASKVILKNIEEQYWEKILLPSGYENGKEYPDIKYTDELTYRIPNSFYLGIRTILKSEAGLKPSANESELYPLTLDRTTEVVPAPSEFSTKKQKDTTDLILNFQNVSVQNFADYILTPANWFLMGSLKNQTLPGSYEVFLYQANYLEGSSTKKNEISDSELIQLADAVNQATPIPDKVVVIDKPLTVKDNAVDFKADEAVLNALRSGKLIKMTFNNDDLKGGADKNSISFIGLEPNQAYYVRIRTVLKSERIKNNKEESRVDVSLFSKTYGFTTNMVSKPVEPDEEVPPTPKEFTAKARDNSSAILHWRDPDLTVSARDTIQYEIVRTTEQQVPKDLLQRNVAVSEIIRLASDRNATLLGSNDYKVIQLDGQSAYELIDETLQPNTLYYYYIRTVYNGITSDWIYQPVTTANIERPISLKAFNATKTTVDISFLAKVLPSTLFGTFDFGIAIQGEDDPSWKTISASSLKTVSTDSKDIQEGYTYYAYRLTDLKPGKRYNIKVCVIDKTKDKIDGKYQQSLYTEIVYIRTEYDQEEQDKEDKYKEFLDRFDKEVEKLLRKPYWTVEAGTTYKYRGDYLAADMRSGSEYTLVTEDKSNEAYYYLPASILTKMNDGETSLRVKLGDDEIVVRPDTLRNDDQLILDAQKLISSNQLKDYYVAVSIKKNSVSGRVNGEETVSAKITISMSLVYMKQEDLLIEADIREALDDIITSNRKTFISRLETKIDRGTLADDILQEIIDDVLGDIQDEHIRKVSRIMDTNTRKTIAVKDINKAVLIIHTSENSGVSGYYYNAGWFKTDVYSTGGSFMIEAAKLGSYIFTGQIPLINIVPEVAPYQDFINKYQLTEFFQMNSTALQSAATKQQVYGALARVMGAQQGTDYVVFLNNNGLKGVSMLGAGQYIRQDETIYMVMQGYEKLRNRKITTIMVRNRQGITNIGAFQPVYRDYVYAAVELKVVQPSNSMVLPSKQMSGKEIIAMLYKMQQ